MRPKNIIKVIQSAGLEFKNCIVTKDTNMYRRLAHAQARPNDTALEIGCDFGYTTKILGEKCKIALGVDKRYPHVKEAIKRYGGAGDNNIFFHAVDIFTDSDNILGKYSDRLNKSPSLIFIDINGNRELQAVVRALNVVYERFQPRLVVIKSSSFFNYLYQDGSRYKKGGLPRLGTTAMARSRARDAGQAGGIPVGAAAACPTPQAVPGVW